VCSSDLKEKVVKRFLFEHIGVNGYHGRLDCNTQSDGTVAVLNLLPAIYDIMNRDCLYCIDEIENSVHPKLILALLNFFSGIQTNGQLIYTTHQTILLGNESELRPDEIWLAEKQNGNTKMYSLNDFKLHNTLNIENGYLAGRFGASPRLGDLNMDAEQ
jgi:AAA15 family ATPase/GTPase